MFNKKLSLILFSSMLIISSCSFDKKNSKFSIKDISPGAGLPNISCPSSDIVPTTISSNSIKIPGESVKITAAAGDLFKIDGVWDGAILGTYGCDSFGSIFTGSLTWDGKDNSGNLVPTGKYIIRGVTPNGDQRFYNPFPPQPPGSIIQNPVFPIIMEVNVVNNQSISLSINKEIVSTKNPSSISFNVSVSDNEPWTITSSTGYSNSGTGKQTFSLNSDVLGSSLQDGVYNFVLSSGKQTSSVNLSIDNTPPKIKSIQALDNGQVNITAEDPSVNGVSSGVAPSNQVVSVNYGNNKQASLNFSIASLNAKQTNNVLTNGNYSVDIKDNVGNTFKLSKGCVDSTNKWLAAVTKQINEYEKALKQKENKMNQLNSNLNKVITQYNSLVQEDKTLGANLISYESLLSQYEAKKNELVNLDSYDPNEWDSLISSIETLQSQIIIADEKSRQLKNQIQNLSNKATSIKDEINIVVSETEQIKTNLNNISLDGVCISSVATDLLKTVLGPEFVIANNIVNTALLATNMYSGYVVSENQVYSDQQEAKSKELRERSKLLAKKVGERYPDIVAKELGLTQDERKKLGKLIEKYKKSEGRGGKDNLDLDTVRELAKEILDARK